MAVDPTAFDEPLARELAAAAAPIGRPRRYRLGDAFLPEGTAPPIGSRLRCCTCGSGAAATDSPAPCTLCGSRAWELLPAPAETRLLR
jgi:hypothetical protein